MVMNNAIDLTDTSKIGKYVSRLFTDAVAMGASDIHLEPRGKQLVVRMRVDGYLRSWHGEEPFSPEPVITRLKIAAGMDIGENRIPQDSNMGLKIAGRNLDLRVSSLPTTNGEKLVLRLLDREQVPLSLKSLHFSPKAFQLYEKLYRAPYGLVLITGPTGSGKTTTLYATLAPLNKASKNLVTIEDPVEYQLEGINQVQVNPKAGLSFAKGLRAFLRQDPDIIMIGEIRDRETAEIALQASLTGHLVFSTLHTNSALGVISRLVDMGVEPYLLVEALQGAVAQRLVRKPCQHCGSMQEASAGEKRYLGKNIDEALQLFKAPGCAKCGYTGYSGRIAVQEVMVMSEELANLFLHGGSKYELQLLVRAQGGTTLYEDGAAKVLAGLTTVDELLAQGISQNIFYDEA